jgi:sodium-independent sulfate anion transporter 11
MWKSKKIDLIPAFATFLTCLFWALEYGIMVGVGIQVLVILYHAARPKVHVEHRILNGIPNSNYIYVTLDRALIFPSVSYVRNQINKAGVQDGESRLPLVLDCAHISSADFTAAEGFKAMISDFRSRNQPIVFFNTSASVVDTFLGVNIDEFVVVHSSEELLAHIRTLIAQNDEEGGPNVDYIINTGATVDDPSRQP